MTGVERDCCRWRLAHVISGSTTRVVRRPREQSGLYGICIPPRRENDKEAKRGAEVMFVLQQDLQRAERALDHIISYPRELLPASHRLREQAGVHGRMMSYILAA